MHLPRLYPNEMDKVYFHHYKASSHTANLTTEYLVKMKAELGISCINKDEIPVKAPDGSPLDFFGFGYLKQRLCPEGPELWMVFGNFLRRYWSEIDIAQIQRVFNSWQEIFTVRWFLVQV